MFRTIGLFLFLLLFSYVFAVTAFQKSPPPKPDPRILPANAVDHSIDYSNILPGDYVGPETCAECHEEQYDLWKMHPHCRMNQNPSEKSIRGEFDGYVLELPTGEAHFLQRDGKYLMEVFKDEKLRRQYEVTRTVGTRYMQAYIGKQIVGPESKDHDIYREHKLPFGYWFKLNLWLPRTYMNASKAETLVHGVPMDESIDGDPAIELYTINCMNCHNTFPYAYRIFNPFMVGFRDATVSAEVHQLSQAVSATIEVGPTPRDFLYLNERLSPEKHFVTMGISCESCHFGGREHAEREREIRYLPTSKLTRLSADNPHHIPSGSRENAYTTRGICTQCHSGISDMFPNGAGVANSREGLDLIAGACASELSCIDCHEPHTGTPKELVGLDLPKHINSCIKCHDKYRDEAFANRHAGPGHASVNCLDCHMPRFTRGVDHLIRTHRVGLPIEESMVAAGKANACNACHLDKSVRWALNEHENIWGHSPKPQKSWSSYHTLDDPAGMMWIKSEDRHMRYLATQWYASSRWAIDQFAVIADSLNDAEPVNRVFASFAISKILGLTPDADFGVNIMKAPGTRQVQIDALVETVKLRMKK